MNEGGWTGGLHTLKGPLCDAEAVLLAGRDGVALPLTQSPLHTVTGQLRGATKHVTRHLIVTAVANRVGGGSTCEYKVNDLQSVESGRVQMKGRSLG